MQSDYDVARKILYNSEIAKDFYIARFRPHKYFSFDVGEYLNVRLKGRNF
jgi:NAD(P)H-flavin reductase